MGWLGCACTRADMLHARLAGLALACVCLTQGALSVAYAYDPAHHWRTVQSPNFRVHYTEGNYALAQEMAAHAESAFADLVRILAFVPDTPIDIVLNDDTDGANGFAQSVPVSLIGLNAVAPDEISELSDYHDWTYELVAHELAHIVHIGTIGGIPRVIDALFGRILAPNGMQPRWFVEGLAVYFESRLGGAGRARSPYFDMFLRAQVLDGTMMSIDTVTGSPRRFPQGTTAYLVGGRFIDFLAARLGDETLSEVSRSYGSRLIPYALNATLEEVAGVRYPELYADFQAELGERFGAQLAQVERLGRIEGETLTAAGQDTGPARVAPDGTVYFVAAPADDHPQLRALIGSEVRNLAWVQWGSQLALFPDRRRVLLAELVNEGPYRSFYDLFVFDLATGTKRRLTRGARSQGIDVSPDGRQVVMAQNQGARSVVRMAELEALDQLETLADLGEHSQVWAPRFSPAGTSVVFVGFAGGRRDLYLLDLQHRSLRKLTDDPAVDGGPSFSPDGNWVLFHSDRDGIFNLYAVPSAGGAVRRLTRVRTGAFQPEMSIDGASVIYRSFSSRGFDVARLAVDPLATLPLAAPADLRPEAPGHANVAVYPTTSYDGLPTLLPQLWMPAFGTDTRGNTYGAWVYGNDAIDRHSYTLQAFWGTTSDFLGFTADYSNRSFFPGVALAASRTLGYAAMPYVRNGRNLGVEEVQWSGQAATTWPLWLSADAGLSLSTSYNVLYRQSTQPLGLDPFDMAPVFPDQGRFVSLRFDLTFSNVQANLDSISAERGISITLGTRVEDPWTGSEYSAVTGSLDLTGYFANPWLKRHVLAIDGSVAYGQSSYRRRKLFALGGVPSRNVLLDAINGSVGSGHALRGYPQSPYSGDALARGSAEYRLPVVDVESGVSTLPFYFRTLSLALFADAAALADAPRDLGHELHASAGAEGMASVSLGYVMPVTLRVGYGHGLREDVQGFYVVLGNTF